MFVELQFKYWITLGKRNRAHNHESLMNINDNINIAKYLTFRILHNINQSQNEGVCLLERKIKRLVSDIVNVRVHHTHNTIKEPYDQNINFIWPEKDMNTKNQ